ncbi:hypothetical protein F511_33367 [Dorcoceras hygrometricum]|uniref:Uncharacterized protein n=1 Tax=Dorcoceras hygrometricum TaxID=472368 RepID=A0A2Z7CFF9_9LAMI|nr:hypothetical protein F511_33367 [Dorcoceras hygrometricum]
MRHLHAARPPWCSHGSGCGWFERDRLEVQPVALRPGAAGSGLTKELSGGCRGCMGVCVRLGLVLGLAWADRFDWTGWFNWIGSVSR